MPDPNGRLTPIQYEIMDAVWRSDETGILAAEIWQEIAVRRSVVRTTVLNQVDRLAKRGWLGRDNSDGSLKYFAVFDREKTESILAEQFVEDYFRGSPSQLVSRLFGGAKIIESEIRAVQKLIEALPQQSRTAIEKGSAE